MLNRALIESTRRWQPWLEWMNPLPTVSQSEASCRKAYGRYLLDQDLRALILLEQTDDLVGGSGLHHSDWQKGCFEIGD